MAGPALQAQEQRARQLRLWPQAAVLGQVEGHTCPPIPRQAEGGAALRQLPGGQERVQLTICLLHR